MPSKFDFAAALVGWQIKHGRHDLPWQHPATPYRVWLSEVMLQQTQVATVVPYFERFIGAFPDISTLAGAPLDAVMVRWAGLGYYSRARNLHRAAQICREHYGGSLPHEFDDLLDLPGIGRSTAGAIMALAYGKPFPILDGNARRVLARFNAIAGPADANTTRRKLWEAAENHTPRSDVRRYTQGMMDLGASVCTRSKPECPICPLKSECRAYAQGAQMAYPEKRNARRRPQRKTVMLIARNGRDEILLKRRPPTGVWGGLWSLPEFAPDGDLVVSAKADLGIKLTAVRKLSSRRHQFTHFTLDISPVRASIHESAGAVMEHNDLRWHSIESPDSIGLPAPVSKLLEEELRAWQEPLIA